MVIRCSEALARRLGASVPFDPHHPKQVTFHIFEVETGAWLLWPSVIEAERPDLYLSDRWPPL